MRVITDFTPSFTSAIWLEYYVPRRWQTFIRLFLFGLSLTLYILAFAAPATPLLSYAPLFWSGGFITAGLWGMSLLLYAFHNSRYYCGFRSTIQQSAPALPGITYEVAALVYDDPSDLSGSFARHPVGREVLLRSGVSPAAIASYSQTPRPTIPANMVPVTDTGVVSLLTLGEYLLTHDTGLQQLLTEAGVRNELYRGALVWVALRQENRKQSERWWSKDNLARIPGLGRSWTYGRAYALERYTRSITTSSVFSAITTNMAYATEKVTEIETILSRDKASNVLIIGEPGVGKMDLVVTLSDHLYRNSVRNALAGKEIIVLDTDRLFALHSDKGALEYTFLSMLNEAARAGNLIVVIENVSTFIREAQRLGVEAADLLDPYLATPDLHIIATDTPSAYHSELETLGGFTRRFSEVLVEPADLTSSINVLLGVAIPQEQKHHLLFTYGAIEAIVIAADRFVVDGVMPDKAVTLLSDVAAAATPGIVNSDYVYSFVSKKTGVPVGPIGETERNKLTQLEATLHERVVGQDHAISAIARTMRRARAGIQNAERPIGSFLFLGPTGVGKTETAKALAFTFFGSEEHMHRIDMSEYSGVDALNRLIGTAEQSGSLADMLREHPYSVVLLDEFEKAHRAVHDLFLQILDEGRFTDGRGQIINARNAIFIATSNAGSDLILRTVAQRRELATLERALIDHIIAEGIYRPELINRFDSTIVFEPLTREEQGQVANLMLNDLYHRIKQQGYELIVSRDLMDVLVEKGYDPKFGARPMQRVIQNIIEEKVAQKIIMGEVPKGGTLTLSKADIADAELVV